MKVGTLESMIDKEMRHGKGSYKQLVFECVVILHLLNRHPNRTWCNSKRYNCATYASLTLNNYVRHCPTLLMVVYVVNRYICMKYINQYLFLKISIFVTCSQYFCTRGLAAMGPS